MSITDETLSIEESAALAKCGVECMKELIDTGEVYAVKLNQKHTVLLREDVIDYLRRRARTEAKARRLARQAKAPAPAPDAIQRRPGRRRRPLPGLVPSAEVAT